MAQSKLSLAAAATQETDENQRDKGPLSTVQSSTPPTSSKTFANLPTTNTSSSSLHSSNDNNNTQSWWLPSFLVHSIHPGHVLLLTSIPIFAGAVRDYRKPLEQVVEETLKKQKTVQNVAMAKEAIRRAVGSAVASRALGVATRGSVGAFGLVGAGLVYASGAQSLHEAVDVTQSWAQSVRRRCFERMGVPDPLGRNHPDYVATQGMTEEEELEYLSKTYFSEEALQKETSPSRSETGWT